jgi:hypothetical protein
MLKKAGLLNLQPKSEPANHPSTRHLTRPRNSTLWESLPRHNASLNDPVGSFRLLRLQTSHGPRSSKPWNDLLGDGSDLLLSGTSPPETLKAHTQNDMETPHREGRSRRFCTCLDSFQVHRRCMVCKGWICCGCLELLVAQQRMMRPQGHLLPRFTVALLSLPLLFAR